MTGFIVCIDGIDSAGKNTQAVLLNDALKSLGYGVSLHSYPDYTSRYGKIIRDYLDKKISLNVNELFLMFLSDMVKDKEIVEREIEQDKVIIMDRYFIDTIAYQSAGGFGFEVGKRIEEFLGLPQPKIVVYLDIPASVSFERKIKQGNKPDRHEENLAYLEKVRGFYDRLFAERYTTGTWVKMDGCKTIGEIHKTVLQLVVDTAKKQINEVTTD